VYVGIAARVRWEMRVASRVRQIVPVSRYVSAVRDTVRCRGRMSVGRPDSVHLVAGRIVTVVPSAMAARKAEEGHGGHTGGSKNHAEDVEVHLSIEGE
jgi:hypothetical protein